jgi:fibronectin type 3 domain-containing protein
MKSKSILAWDKIDKASSYNVYKKNKTSGQFELVKNVKEPRIEINIS